VRKGKGKVKERAVKYEVVKMEEGIAGKPPKRPMVSQNKLVHPQEEVHYMSEKEFLEKAPDNKVWELRYGELIIHSPVRVKHKSLDIFLSYIIFGYVNAKGLGRVFNSPMAVKFERNLIYEPDIFFVSSTNLGKVEEVIFNGVPDLVVEVLSPSMVRHDRVTKFVDYERFGVKEYWILDPHKKEYNFYRNIRGKFRERLSEEGIYRCEEIKGFYVKMEWLENEKYWSERNVNKIIYELIGEEDIVRYMDSKKVIKAIGEEKIIEDIGEEEAIKVIGGKKAIKIIGEEEFIDAIGEERLLKLIEKKKKSKKRE